MQRVLRRIGFVVLAWVVLTWPPSHAQDESPGTDAGSPTTGRPPHANWTCYDADGAPRQLDASARACTAADLDGDGRVDLLLALGSSWRLGGEHVHVVLDVLAEPRIECLPAWLHEGLSLAGSLALFVRHQPLVVLWGSGADAVRILARSPQERGRGSLRRGCRTAR